MVHPALVAVLLVPILLAGCGDESLPRTEDGSTTAPPAPSSTSPTTALLVDPDRPPPLVLHSSAGDDEAFPGSFCWSSGSSGGCADTVMPNLDRLPVVEGDDQLGFTFPVAGWSFQASFSPVDATECSRSYTVEATRIAEGEFTVPAAGGPGDYLVSLFGRGPQGDVGGHFRWRTDDQGFLPAPEATASVVWAPHGEVEGQGASVTVSDLPRSPGRVSAQLTATAANGANATLDLGRPTSRCPEGWLFFRERGTKFADDVAALGPPPFVYDVVLVLGDVEHRASATWPDDHVEDEFNDDPATVPLEVVPPLG